MLTSKPLSVKKLLAKLQMLEKLGDGDKPIQFLLVNKQGIMRPGKRIEFGQIVRTEGDVFIDLVE